MKRGTYRRKRLVPAYVPQVQGQAWLRRRTIARAVTSFAVGLVGAAIVWGLLIAAIVIFSTVTDR